MYQKPTNSKRKTEKLWCVLNQGERYHQPELWNSNHKDCVERKAR